MNWLKNLSIRYKITFIIVFVTIVSTIATLSSFIYIDIKHRQNELLSALTSDARLIGAYCAPQMILNDKLVAEDFLKKIELVNYMASVAVYDSKGNFFAGYNTDKSIINFFDLLKPLNFSEPFVYIREPIEYYDQKIGTIIIKARTNELKRNTERLIYMGSIIFFVILVISFILAEQFQKLLSKPIIKLANTAKQVSLSQNYSIRIKRETRDEIGFLFDSFNNMLEQVEHRDKERSEQEYILNFAKDRAEQADKLKSAFLANMSHEIRTPMNSIIGFTSLLNMDDISEEERKLYLQLIQSSGDTLLHLIDDIIDISRIEADQIVIQKTTFNLHDLLEEVYLKYSREISISEKHGLLDLVYNQSNSSDLEINTDLFRLKQIITNLISNALKFTDKGYIEFGFTVESSHFRFYVKDSGIGLPEDMKAEIFNRFVKVESGDKLYRGAGLGLTITKKLVEILGGTIWVESKPNLGSVFYFTLPYNPNYKGYSAKLEVKPKAVVDNHFDLSGKTILVAEDERSNYLLIEQILKNSGATIVWAQNGKIAIEEFKKQRIDLVLMDIKMPEIDGYEATRVIKDLNHSIPIISQTAYAMSSDKEKIFEAGCDDYIVKPIKAAELKSKIAKYV